jgi:ABC-type branched-subunit amino acid transport system substrate-binding protein
MKKSIIVWFIIIIVVIGIIVVTTHKRQPEGGGMKKLEVAVVIPLTGSNSSLGEDFLNGLLLAKEKINPDIILNIEDSKSNANDGIMAAKKLLDTKNIDVIVSLQSAVVIPLLAIADQYDKPLIATAVAQNEFTQKSKNAFRLFPPAKQYTSLAAEFASKMGFNKVSTLTIHDEYGESIKEQFKKDFKGSIPHQENFEVSEQDFRTILTKISDSEAIYSVGYDIHWVNLFKQREELGKNITFISNQNMTSNFVKSRVGSLLTNAYATVPESVLVNEKTKEFSEEYTKKYGHEPDWGAPFGYDILLILDAIQKNGKKPIDALHEIKIDGLNGSISFGENREANIPLVVVRAKDGIIEDIKE